MKHYNTTQTIAAVDIGSNTLLMQILKKHPDSVPVIIAEEHGIARLSGNLETTGSISKDAIARAAAILTHFDAVCKKYEVTQIVAVATAALREASNGKEVAKILGQNFKYKKTKINIISGEQEAEYTFFGAICNVPNDDVFTIIDIGGASTELINGTKDGIISKISIPIGVVKITEMFQISQPVRNNIIQQVSDFIKAKLNTISPKAYNGKIIAVSGTPTTLAAMTQNLKEYDPSKIEGYIFEQGTFKNICNIVFNSTLQQLITNYYIPLGRADVLSAGCIILNTLLSHLEKTSFIVSNNGLRHGIALNALYKS